MWLESPLLGSMMALCVLLPETLAWIVLPATLWLAPREKNINWVHGFGHPPRSPFGPSVHFALMMLVYPTLVCLPAHWLLLWLVRA